MVPRISIGPAGYPSTGTKRGEAGLPRRATQLGAPGPGSVHQDSHDGEVMYIGVREWAQATRIDEMGGMGSRMATSNESARRWWSGREDEGVAPGYGGRV